MRTRGNGDSSGRSRPSQQLPTAVQTSILSLLPPNDRTLSGRLVSPDAADGLSGPQHCTASLFQPLPPHAAAWAVAAGQQHVRQLPFHHKVQLLCTAAASGSRINLEVALALLQPSIFPGHLHSWDSEDCPDPGVAAVEAGHPQLLGWLMHHCPDLIRTEGVLTAAARHCTLAGLQATWERLLAWYFSPSGSADLMYIVTFEAAASVASDGLAKLQWLLAKAGFIPRDRQLIAQAAARSGDVARLRWLQGRGFPVGEWAVLKEALQHADLAVVQWLVDEAGCELPAAGGGDTTAEQRERTWTALLLAAANSRDAVAKWRWLHERGGPSVVGAGRGLVKELALAAVRAGQVEAVQYLLSVLGAEKVLAAGRDALCSAAGQSGSIAVAECLQRAGFVFSHAAYRSDWLSPGKLPVIRWLATEAKVSAAGCTWRELQTLILNWPSNTPAHSRDLLEAVQLLTGAGFSDWGGENLTKCAIGRGELDLVRYLMQQGAPLDPDLSTIEAAAGAGCVPLLEFLSALPGSFKPSVYESCPYLIAAEHGDRATLDALRRLGVPWGVDDVLQRAVNYRFRSEGDGEPVHVRYGMHVLRWLGEHGAPLGSVEEMGDMDDHSLSGEVTAWLQGLGVLGTGWPDGEE